MKKDYFELFGLEKKINIDLKKLEDSYIYKQSEFFNDPDMQNTLNQSYEILKDDLQRLEYFLKLMDFQIEENLNPETIEKFYNLNIELEEAEENKKINILLSIKKQIKDYLEKIDRYFNEKNYNLINKILTEIKYLNRISKNH